LGLEKLLVSHGSGKGKMVEEEGWGKRI